MADDKKRNDKKTDKTDKSDKKNDKTDKTESDDSQPSGSEVNKDKTKSESKDDDLKEDKDDRSSNINDSGKDSRSDKDDKSNKPDSESKGNDPKESLDISAMFRHMQSMVQIIRMGYRIDAKYTTTDLSNYGPKEIKPLIMERELEFWDCHSVGDDKKLFISKRCIPTGDWTNCDQYIDIMVNQVLGWLSSYSTILTLEPTKKPVDSVDIYNLEDTGVQTSGFSDNICEYDDLLKILIPFLTPLPSTQAFGLKYFTKMRVAHPKILCDLRNAYFAFMHSCRSEGNRDFISELTRTRDGIRDPRYMDRIDPRIYTYPIHSPRRLCEIMSSIPRALELSYTLTQIVSVPEITTRPISMQQLSTNLGISATRMTFTNTLMNIEYKSSMEESLFAFITYHFTPGVIEIDLQFDDMLVKSDNAFMVACMCKILFSFSIDPRWCNITRASAENIDAIIILYMLRHRMIEPIRPGLDTASRRFSDFVPAQRSKYQGRKYTDLATNDSGRGWANALGQFFGNEDSTIYDSCARRQKFMFDFDEPVNESNIIHTPLAELHPTFEAIKEIIDASDTRQTEFKKFLDTTYERYATFVCGINNYNRKNWFTGFRLSETAMCKPCTYADITRVIPMDWRTVVVILKNFDYTSIGDRRTSYPLQFQYESSFVYDYGKLAVRYSLITRIVNNRLNILSEFKANEIIKLAMSGDYDNDVNPLRDFLHVLSDLKMLRNFTPSLDYMTVHSNEYFQKVLSAMFCIDDLICSTNSSVCLDRLVDVDEIFSSLTQCAKESIPYTIPMQFPTNVILSPTNISSLIKMRQALYFFMTNRKHAISLDLPIKYIAARTDHPINDEQFVKVTYHDDFTKCNFRNSVSYSVIKIYVATPSRTYVMRDRESAIANLPTRMMSGFTDNTASNMLLHAVDWSAGLIATSGVVDVIRMPQLGFCSILTPDIVLDEVCITVNNNIDFSFLKML